MRVAPRSLTSGGTVRPTFILAGALVLALRQPGRYASVSAFAPIVNPSNVPWGQKALSGYLGSDESTWAEYDACALVKKGESKQPFFIDQGSEDKFLTEQLRPELLEQICHQRQHPLVLRHQEGYDHSYFFVATFIDDHLRYHAQHLS